MKYVVMGKSSDTRWDLAWEAGPGAQGQQQLYAGSLAYARAGLANNLRVYLQTDSLGVTWLAQEVIVARASVLNPGQELPVGRYVIYKIEEVKG